MQIVYKGLSAERKKALLNSMCSGMVYPETRTKNGKDLNLLNDEEKGDADRKKFVGEQRAKFKSEFQAQAKASIEQIDAERVIRGVTFRKGQAVEVEDNARSKALISSGDFEAKSAKG